MKYANCISHFVVETDNIEEGSRKEKSSGERKSRKRRSPRKTVTTWDSPLSPDSQSESGDPSSHIDIPNTLCIKVSRHFTQIIFTHFVIKYNISITLPCTTKDVKILIKQSVTIESKSVFIDLFLVTIIFGFYSRGSQEKKVAMAKCQGSLPLLAL